MKKKRALVLSGGGSKGAYSVGVVKALLESGRKYDVVAGVSVGALIGSFIAQFPPETQWDNYKELERIWTKEVKGNRSIYKNWAPWFLTYIWSFWKSGIYSMKPLRDIVAKRLRPDALKNSGVELEVGVVSLQTGKYRSVNISSDPSGNQLAVDWIWASCIFPVMFQPTEIAGEQWLDGGIRNVIPVDDVLKYDVTHIDAVLTAPRDGYVPINKEIYKSAVDVALRGAELLSDEVYANDLSDRCGKKNVELNIYDPVDLVNEDSFEFDPDEIKSLIERGYQETKAKLSQG